jgi:hypothetical protein
LRRWKISIFWEWFFFYSFHLCNYCYYFWEKFKFESSKSKQASYASVTHTHALNFVQILWGLYIFINFSSPPFQIEKERFKIYSPHIWLLQKRVFPGIFLWFSMYSNLFFQLFFFTFNFPCEYFRFFHWLTPK